MVYLILLDDFALWPCLQNLRVPWLACFVFLSSCDAVVVLTFALIMCTRGLFGEDFVAPIDDEEHLLFLCESTKDIRLRFAGLPISSLRSLMMCEDVGSVAWFVHECMERVDNSHTG
jgi:hypothetical protein